MNTEDIEHTVHELRSEIERLRAELEVWQLRLVACDVAALGYFTGCAKEYESAALQVVLALRTELDKLRAQLDWFEQREPSVQKLRQDFYDTVASEWNADVAEHLLLDYDLWIKAHPKP